MGPPTEPTYFTCTLGQAAAHKRGLDRNINDFIGQQADENPELPAVGFYVPSSDSTKLWQHEVLTFEEVYQGSCATADSILNVVHIPEQETVALLCPSSADFLLIWLALMRLGHPVLLIAPQCSASAIAHLCKQCGTSVIFCDDIYKALASEAAAAATDLDSQLQPQSLPLIGESSAFQISRKKVANKPISIEISDTEVAYLHHTSGTSTGIPKPIPQSHRAGCGVLPRLHGGQHATFTTTPLYHGGIADLFRAWTSNALIWLFPGKEAPITASNVVRCLDSAKASDTPTVKYFSSVPYVLEMMASDEKGLQWLRDMDLVGVGGAALPSQIGDDLVRKGVNLVSRYGSAECGFLMSSHRDYEQDKEWTYLRQEENSKYLRLEKREEGLSELVVLPGWPHIAKTNREDGSFATSDLFAAHPTVSNAWKYAARADSQLTLVTGKKFDPSPLESAIAASSPLLQDVLVFGNGMPYPGTLLFRSKQGASCSDEEITSRLSSTVEDLNRESQSHARIPRNMLVPIIYTEQPLEKSSKGTILRGKAEERYATEISRAYENVSTINEEIPDEEVERRVLDTVASVMQASNHASGNLGPETDLFAYGVDSVACVQIRHAASRLVPNESRELPMTIVQDSGTVRALSQRILDRRHGRQRSDEVGQDQEQLMEKLVVQYSQSPTLGLNGTLTTPARSPQGDGKVVLLTGPTGSLGSHLFSQLLNSPDVRHIHLLLRGATQEAARERVRKALESRKLSQPPDFESKVSIHTCKLAEARLGLAGDVYEKLALEVDVVYHLAWAVDFLLPLQAFRQHFAGLQALLGLSKARPRSTPCKFIFCSSTASVASFNEVHLGQPVPEQLVTDPKVSGAIGYARSKWVAENICLRAVDSRSDTSIVRVGQVSGDTQHGIWNKSEAYPLMLASAKVTRCLPDLPNEVVDWIPVDVAATALVELLSVNDQASKSGIRTSHVLNNDRTTTWNMLLDMIRKDAEFEIVPVDEWLSKLEGMHSSNCDEKSKHPSLKLLDFWKNAYGSSSTAQSESAKRNLAYETSLSCEAMPVLSKVKPVSSDYALKLWRWCEENI